MTADDSSSTEQPSFLLSFFLTQLQNVHSGSSVLATILDVVFSVALVYGCWKALWGMWACGKAVNKHCCRSRCQKKDRLYQLYGNSKAGSQEERSWAVVTGGSDGIGLAMAKKLAVDSKFNICIIGRNEEKMKTKLEEINKVCKEECGVEVQTKYVVADFAEMLTIQDYQDTLVEPLKDLDIGVLVLNAGWVQMGPFEWLT